MRVLLYLCLIGLLFSPITFANDYHLLKSRDDGRAIRVVFHIPVPAEINSLGINLRTALSQSKGGNNFVSQVPWISAGELAQLQNGELYEHAATIKFLAAATNARKRQKIDKRFTALSTKVVNKIRVRLKFYGSNRDVP